MTANDQKLREAQIVLPTVNNAGQSLAKAHSDLTRSIIAKFGGVTITEGKGAWTAEDGKLFAEPVDIYTFAAPTDNNSRQWISARAYALLGEAGQLAIFVRYPDGEVEIVED